MRIFLTGATGYIGSAVLDALVRGGHDVTALVRDNEKARRVAKRGGHPAIGDLANPESFRAAAAANEHLRTAIVRPGVVYGRRSGMVGDIFKAASNGLVRVVGDGNNHWPLIYDRDLADLYARLAACEDAAGIYHANDEGDERVND